MQRTTIDGIQIIAITRPNVAKTVMMLHGFGANYDDLASLAPHLDPRGEWNWVFPNGILEIPLGPHMVGRAWFPIRMAEIEAAAMRGDVVDFADVLPEGMDEAGKRLAALIKHLHIEPEHLVIGGFSQGAMMAIQVMNSLAGDIKGLVLFSGTLINRLAWVDRLPSRAAVPFIQSHGRSDPMLGFSHAVRLHETLQKAGLHGEFLAFDGGHEIPFPVIQKTEHFLSELC